MSKSQVIALVNYMSQILVELVKLANLIITLNDTLRTPDMSRRRTCPVAAQSARQ